MNRYEVGTHMHKRHFSCQECAERFYSEIKDEQLTYLMEKHKNIILQNTYGWRNGE